MGGNCFNCAAPATGRYTVVLDSGERMECKPLCGECAAAFRDIGWIDLVDGPAPADSGSADRELRET